MQEQGEVKSQTLYKPVPILKRGLNYSPSSNCCSELISAFVFVLRLSE